MADLGFRLELLALVLLVGCLIYQRAKRTARRAAFLQQFQRPGVGLDTAPLLPRLAMVRRDFALAAQAHAAGLRARHAWLAAARLRLEQLPFFGHPPAESTGRSD
ncbi:MAG TPA: hypothetical protein VFV96_16010 [Verrucomicrobiae bacterium]|nr:hypothetical protein [Verrucomicrobiae bacterium]